MLRERGWRSMNKLKLLEKYITKELQGLRENVISNFSENIENRKLNPFLCIDNKEIVKYMALGRSLDSQLGNRIQHIILYCTRLRYGIENVPNIISINDVSKKEINLKLFYVDIDANEKELKKDAQLANQYIYINKKMDIEKAKSKLKIKKSSNILKEKEISYLSSEHSLNAPKYTIPVDLLFFIDDGTINTFEIKMGGNLDTKNAKSNADEVKMLQNLFSFIENNHSYFATCYGTCSEAVRKKLNTSQVLNGKDFWDKVLPEEISYEEFIGLFKKVFKKLKIAQALKKLTI